MSRTFTGASGSYLGSSTGITITASNSYTFSAWIYPTSWGGSSGGSVIALGSFDNSLFTLANGTLKAQFTTAKITEASATSVENVLTLNTWQYVTGLFNAATGVVHLFVNGVEVSYASQVNHTGTHSETQDVYVGNNFTSGATGAFQGSIDSAAIWNVALTTAQIQAAMAYRGTPAVLPDSLLAYWPLLGSSSPEPDSPTTTYPLTVGNATQGPGSPGQQLPSPPYTPTIPLPFSKRTTAATAVFACLAVASPLQGAPTLTSNAVILADIQLEYAQLVNLYPTLIHQDTANNKADLYADIATAITVVGELNATIDAMMASGDQGFVLARMQSIVANALANLKAAQFDET